MLERARGLCQDWHIPLFLPELAAALGLAYTLDGRVAAGLALFVAWLSEAYLLAGRLEDARQRAAQALDLARQYKQCGWQAWSLWLLGESTARHEPSEVEPATGHYHQALALTEELGMRPLQAHCHHGLGLLYGQTGRGAQARAALATAIALYRDMAMTFWLPQAEAVRAQVESMP